MTLEDVVAPAQRASDVIPATRGDGGILGEQLSPLGGKDATVTYRHEVVLAVVLGVCGIGAYESGIVLNHHVHQVILGKIVCIKVLDPGTHDVIGNKLVWRFTLVVVVFGVAAGAVLLYRSLIPRHVKSPYNRPMGPDRPD